MGRRTAYPAAAALAVLVAGLAACSRGAPSDPPPQPATLRSYGGSSLPEVVLTPDAQRRLGVTTVAVRRDPGDRTLTEIPETALVYDPDGHPWTYRQVAPRGYLRTAVEVDRTTGETVLLRSGPPAGTPVVDTGAPELLGTEYGVGEE
jgi:hypothetical protein